MPDLLTAYRRCLQQGWQPDAAQSHAAHRLQQLLDELATAKQQAPVGLWLYSPPGRGKSQLLDMFMQMAPLPARRRVHFHAFMEEIHRRLHAMPPSSGKTDPLQLLADELAAEATLLGFDEFYLTNIADAMLLGRLMKLLFQRGVVVVATSNWPLPELFQGGLNRDRFLPFLKLMEAHLEQVDLTGGPDFRSQGLPVTAGAPSKLPEHYIVTAPGESAEAQLHVLFNEFSGGPEQPALNGWDNPGAIRQIRKKQGRAVWLTFGQACDTPHSRADYARLAAHFDTVVLEGVPVLGPREADATLRLATLVDILYESHRRLVMSAAAAPQQLCTSGDAAQVFERTTSRLMEMTRADAVRRPAGAPPKKAIQQARLRAVPSKPIS